MCCALYTTHTDSCIPRLAFLCNFDARYDAMRARQTRRIAISPRLYRQILRMVVFLLYSSQTERNRGVLRQQGQKRTCLEKPVKRLPFRKACIFTGAMPQTQVRCERLPLASREFSTGSPLIGADGMMLAGYTIAACLTALCFPRVPTWNRFAARRRALCKHIRIGIRSKQEADYSLRRIFSMALSLASSIKGWHLQET